MSSLKMTFSLTSLILIIALGLVFVPTSVMAHDTDANTAGDQPDGHVHPMVTISSANGNDAAGTIGLEFTDPDPTADPVTTDDFTATFELMVEFDVTVTGASAGLTPTLRFFDTDGTLIPNDGSNISSGTVPALDDDADATTTTLADGKIFKSMVTLTDNRDNTADGFAALAIIEVTVPAGAVGSEALDTTGTLPVSRATFGVASEEAKALFRVASKVDPPADNTVMIAPESGAGLDAAFDVIFTFTPAVETFIGDNIDVIGGSVTAEPMQDSTDDTMWTATITPNVGATEITISVDPSVAGPAEEMGMATVPATGNTGITLAAGGYLVIVGDGFADTTLPGVTTTEVNGFPADLAAFFISGGTVDVSATNGDVIISEFMVARDTSKIGAGNPNEGQWIELHNKHAVDATVTTDDATNIMVTFSDTKPAVEAADGVVDRLSNVVNPGWNFSNTFGAAALSGNPGDADTALVPFISIRRKADKFGANGWESGSWEKTPTTLTFAAGRVGTPGKVNAPPTFKPVANTKPSRTEVTINEVANRTDDTNEWIELKGPAGKSLKNYRISIVKKPAAGATAEETVIYTFPGDDSIKIKSNGLLLLTDKSPTDNELEADWTNHEHKPQRYNTVELGALPNDTDEFIIILRDETDKAKVASIEDIAGYADLAVADPYTTLWPLTGDVGKLNAKNKLAAGKVYQRNHTGVDGYSQSGDDANKPAFGARGFTGIGYDRNAAVNDENGGTPGYDNGSLKGDGTDATSAVMITEIMYAKHDRGDAPQWIELRNMSKTVGVNLGLWELIIVNHSEMMDGESMVDFPDKYMEVINLEAETIPPGQSYLIAARTANEDTTNLPPNRKQILNKTRKQYLLNPYGFQLTLRTKRDKAVGDREQVDRVGNLKPAPEGDRRSDAQSFNDDVAWQLPNALTDEGSRISIVRVPGKNNSGTAKSAWALYNMTNEYANISRDTDYGSKSDIGSPGHHWGGVLPVSLSTFRPERLKDTGEIVVRWVTESELNNAGFNILRSEKRDKDFTKVHYVAGQGTTSERTVYEWKDTSAKPNVVYYYQIQDVSLDGEVTTLRTTHLRGNVTAAGKATTTWGEIKALQ